MKTTKRILAHGIAAAAVLAFAGCNRQSRGNADALDQNGPKPQAEGGTVSTAGDAGKAENFGDSRKSTETKGVSPSASPTGLSKDASAAERSPETPPAPPPRQN